MLNKSTIQGRIVREMELRVTGGGMSVASGTIAWSEKRGENENKLFLPIVLWGQTAESAVKYFHKGQECIVEGRLGSRSWTDKQGNKRETIEMTVDRIHFCGPKQGGSQAPVDDFAEMEDMNQELPF